MFIRVHVNSPHPTLTLRAFGGCQRMLHPPHSVKRSPLLLLPWVSWRAPRVRPMAGRGNSVLLQGTNTKKERPLLCSVHSATFLPPRRQPEANQTFSVGEREDNISQSGSAPTELEAGKVPAGSRATAQNEEAACRAKGVQPLIQSTQQASPRSSGHRRAARRGAAKAKGAEG